MTERRPRPSDYDTVGRYYSALLGWLEWHYPRQADRVKKWRKIERKNAMPVQRDPKEKPKTAQQLAAERQLEETFEMIDRMPGGEAERRARIIALIELDRDLDPAEQAEFDKYIKRRDRHRRQRRRLDAAIDARQLKHPEEDRGDSALAVMLKQSDKRERRRARRNEREAAAERIREHEQAETATQAAHEAASVPVAPVVAPADEQALAPVEAAPPRRQRAAYGIVAQYDQFGNRVA